MGKLGKNRDTQGELRKNQEKVCIFMEILGIQEFLPALRSCFLPHLSRKLCGSPPPNPPERGGVNLELSSHFFQRDMKIPETRGCQKMDFSVTELGQMKCARGLFCTFFSGEEALVLRKAKNCSEQIQGAVILRFNLKS